MKRILSVFLSAIFFLLVPYHAMAESSPYGYLTKEEIDAMEGNTNKNPIANTNGTTYSKETISEDQAYSLLGQMQKLFGQGLYLEASQLASDTLNKYIVPNAPKELIELMIQSSDYMYQQYLLKTQRFTYRVPGWGMNITCRGDMTPSLNEYNDGVSFYDYDDTGNTFSICSYEIGKKTEQGIMVNSAKQFVDASIKSEQEFYRERNIYHYEYGMKHDIISANEMVVSGIPAYQVVRRISFYENRYWTEASHWIIKTIAYQYGQWMYVIEASEPFYNWSDDFWNAMEVVINGISFS